MFEKTSIFEQHTPKKLLSCWQHAVVILIICQLALSLVYIKTVPRFYHDEAWEASLGHSLAYEGRLRHGIIEGWGGMHIHFVQNQVVLPWICAAIYRLAGFGLTTSRLGSVILSVIAIISTYGVTRRWFGHRQALLIGLATVFHPWFFEVSRRVRPEIYYIAFSLAALWALVRALDSRSHRTLFLAGLLAGLAALAHPTGLVLIFSLSVAVVVWQPAKINKRIVLWTAVGFAAALLPYVLYVLWCIEDPRISFYEQMMVGRLRGPRLMGEFFRWKHFLQWPKGAPLALILFASWLWGCYRSTSADKILATTIAIYSIVLPFATVNNTSRYLVALSPLFCALLVRFVWRITVPGSPIAPGRWRNCRIITGLCIAGIYLVMSLTAISIMFYRLHKADLYKLLDRVAAPIDPGSRVYGEMIFWMEQKRYHYGPYPVEFRDGEWQQDIEAVMKHRFDYAVRTAWLWASSHGVALPPATMPAFRPSYTLDEVCRRFGTKIDEFRDPYFGPVEIYKLNWDRGSNNKDSEMSASN
ncbi:MAG: glycosyltransferase family 39 protein [Planctomycetota bacterium]|jgi:hypothetical protein